MLSKAIFGIIGVALMIAFLAPIVIKLQEISLAIVVAIGLVLMLVDMVQSIKSKED